MPAVVSGEGCGTNNGTIAPGGGGTGGTSGTSGTSGTNPTNTTNASGELGSREIPDKIWQALKRHIIRERQRKKEEHEAEVEEERLRKEREARERQDVMTLGETREQIQQLELKLTKLKEEKHQLFLQLKKVLNEDDNRKRQQSKDTNEMMANMNGMVQSGNVVQTQLFMPSNISQGNPNIGRPPLSAHMLNKGASSMKRGRSPSPPYVQSQPNPHSGAPYLHHPHHKQQHGSPYQGPPPHKVEDGRCREMARAVLWNKPSQYSTGNTASSFYAMPPMEQRSAQLLYATAPMYHAHHVQHHTPPKQVSHSPYHVDVKHEIKKESPVVMGLGEPHQPSYLTQQPPPGIPPASSAPPVPSSSVVGMRHSNQQTLLTAPPPMHQNVVSMQHNNVQVEYKINTPKPGGITSGYPVRQQSPSVQNPNLYPNRHRY